MASVVCVVYTNTTKSRNVPISCRYNLNKLNHLKCDVYLNYIKVSFIPTRKHKTCPL